MEKKISFVKHLLSQGQTETAINTLNDFISGGISLEEYSINGKALEFQSEIISISNRYHSINKKSRKNILSHDYVNLEQSRIVDSILKLIREIEQLITNKNSISSLYSNDQLGDPSNAGVLIDQATSDIEITINKNFDDFSIHDQKELLQVFAHLLNINSKSIKIKGKRRGSVKLTIELSTEKALQLKTLIDAGVLEDYLVVDGQVLGPFGDFEYETIYCGNEDFLNKEIVPILGEDFIKYKFHNFFRAFNFLENVTKNTNQNKPYVLIVDHELMAGDNFNFIKNIRASKNLKHFPILMFAKRDANIKAIDLLRIGIDDCYQQEIFSKKDIVNRIKFLLTYKKDMENDNLIEVANPEYKIPFIKRIFDIAFASAVLVILSPVLLLIALIIKLGSKGPIIYKSKRVGTGYQQFDFLKFRSMVVDADEKLKKLSHLNNYATEKDDKSVSFVKITNDPRITKTGKFIRKHYLDELPQLINVLKGEMSIVGNRPLPLYEAEQMTRDEWAKRFLAPAGLTGLWQVSTDDKDKLSVEERIQLDIEYAEKYSIWMDIKIILRTLPTIWKGEK